MSQDVEAAGAGAGEQPASVPELRKVLLDASAPMAQRTRTVFLLKSAGTPAALDALVAAMRDDSALLAHEAAYALGQTRNVAVVPALLDVLQDTSLSVVVRHEAAEACGAIGDASARPVLEQFVSAPEPEVAETCRVSLDLLRYRDDKPDAYEQQVVGNRYDSIDPAVPGSSEVTASVQQLAQQLGDETRPISERYAALFELRNRASDEAVRVIATELVRDKSSALFRHELAYVLGQLQHKAAVPELTQALRNDAEHAMVRHEAAEALGAVADDEILPVLQQYAKDPHRIVRESCEVALDLYQYHSTDAFDKPVAATED